MPSAANSAMNSPVRPPSSDPMSSTNALSPPSRTAVFRPFMWWLCMTLHFLLAEPGPRPPYLGRPIPYPCALNDRVTTPVPPPDVTRPTRRARPGRKGEDGDMADDAPATTQTAVQTAGTTSRAPAAREIRVERRGRVEVITVSDPARRNAMAVDLARDLVAAVRRAESDAGVGAIVVTGEPP